MKTLETVHAMTCRTFSIIYVLMIFVVRIIVLMTFVEMIFKMKNTFQNLISANKQCLFHKPHFVKLVP
jgi:hypothetical protein